MFGNKFSIFEAIDVWELWNQLPQICLLYHGRHGVFTIHQWVHVLQFFWSQIRRVDTETPPQLVEEEHLQMMDFGTTVGKSVNFHPVSSCGKTLPERFRNSIRNRHFPVIFHIASLNLFLFLFSITIAGSLQQKSTGITGGSKNRWLCWDHQRDQWSKSTTIATSAAPWTTSTWQWPFYGRCAEGNGLSGFFGPWLVDVCVKSFTTLTSEKKGETSFQRMLKSRWQDAMLFHQTNIHLDLWGALNISIQDLRWCLRPVDPVTLTIV